jgi:Ca2+-binding RTX toxin-like protein
VIRRTVVLTALLLAIAAVLSVQSGAVDVGERPDGTIDIGSDPSEPPQDSVITIRFDAASPATYDDTYVVTDAAGISGVQNCASPSPDDGTTIICPGEGVRRILVSLGKGDDRLAILDIPAATRVQVRGGDGNDTVIAGAANTMRFGVSGESGADTLKGTGASDLLLGGPGPDRLRGLRGGDELDGGPGRDRGSGGPGNDNCESIEAGAEAECS